MKSYDKQILYMVIHSKQQALPGYPWNSGFLHPSEVSNEDLQNLLSSHKNNHMHSNFSNTPLRLSILHIWSTYAKRSLSITYFS